VRNTDIKSRFDDWLINPSETLDFEVKQWLDLTDAENKGLIAKALIALENNGGGFLLIGFKDEAGRLRPDPDRPQSLDRFTTDTMNDIIKGRAEPTFHVEVTLQRHPLTDEEFPLIRVAGTSKVPVRSSSETPRSSLKNNVYYIRAPGPASRAPQTAKEWDSLMRRCLNNQRQEIIELSRHILAGDIGALSSSAPKAQDTLKAFNDKAMVRWRRLNDALADDKAHKITLGYWAFSASISGVSNHRTAGEIVAANRSARRYTGWTVFINPTHLSSGPSMVDGTIEAWLGKDEYGGPGFADFWRIDPAGHFFLLRGFQEDELDQSKRGKLFEASIAMWRLGEFLLRIADLADYMFQDGYKVHVHCTWTGLAGRRLYSHTGRRSLRAGICNDDSATTTAELDRATIRDLLPEAVKSLTLELYQRFSFFEPSADFYASELADLKTGQW